VTTKLRFKRPLFDGHGGSTRSALNHHKGTVGGTL
jgi:hypothetical protein